MEFLRLPQAVSRRGVNLLLALAPFAVLARGREALADSVPLRHAIAMHGEPALPKGSWP